MRGQTLRTQMKVMPGDYKPGDPVNKRGVAEGISKLRYAIENMEIHVTGGTGSIEYVNGKIVIRIDVDE